MHFLRACLIFVQVIIGAGVSPATGFVQACDSIKFERDRSIIVDNTLATGAPGLFAAGDLARYPMPFLNDKLVRIEHWGMAMIHGKIAARTCWEEVYVFLVSLGLNYF